MPTTVSSSIKISNDMKSPDRISSEYEITSEGTTENNPTSIKDTFDTKTNLIKHEVMNSVVAIKIDGNAQHQGTLISIKFVYHQ